MVKKINKTSKEMANTIPKARVQEPRPTLFIEDDMTSPPYCALPENFFDFALAREALNKETALLSIDRWDGREILSVIRKQ